MAGRNQIGELSIVLRSDNHYRFVPEFMYCHTLWSVRMARNFTMKIFIFKETVLRHFRSFVFMDR
jgi:hypothetical protein